MESDYDYWWCIALLKLNTEKVEVITCKYRHLIAY